jgi:dienelactone hydrolase
MLIVATFSPSLRGQTATSERSPSRLEIFLRRQASELLAQRRRAVAALKTPEQITQRQNELKAFLERSLGELPDRERVESKIVGTLHHEGYDVEKLILQSRDRHHITANLYLPHGKPPFPGVLVPCGHTANGKAGDTYQQICILLARNGMAALCYDPIGQGERVQKLDASGRPAIAQGSTTEHTMAGIGALLVGRQTATYRVWDGLQALNYLAHDTRIDPRRIGCTGNSGGGTMTAYLMALDDRIAVAAPSCYITSLDRLFATIGPQDAEQNITGQVAAGLDHADFVTMRAPRPTLLCVGTQDFFDIQGSWDTFREVKLIYGRLGFGERVEIFESDEPHGFTSPRRVASARWLRRWPLKSDDAIMEPHLPIAQEKDLQCTPSGQVLNLRDELSVFDLNAQREEKLRSARATFCRRASASEFRSRIKELLGLRGRGPGPRILRVMQENRTALHLIRKLEMETEPGITLALAEVIPDWPDRKAPILVKLGTDHQRELAHGGPVERSVRRGQRVVLAEMRGMSERGTATEPARPGSPLGQNVKEAFLSLHIGRPLLGQRVFDLLCLVESLRSNLRPNQFEGFELEATGPAGLAVLHAAALDEEGLIRGIALTKTLCSWADVVRQGVSRNQLACVVPGVLEFYDLPDLAARLEPLPLEIRQSVDAVGQPISRSMLDTAYAACRNAYGSRGALVLQSGP